MSPTPTKPAEIKRRTGNPGKRALPKLDAIDVLPAAVGVPVPPEPLGWAGMDLWGRAWATGVRWVSPSSDMHLLLLTCQMLDERAPLRARVLAEQDNTDRRALRDLEKAVVGNLSLLGFTPTDRSRLGVAEVRVASKLDELKAKRPVTGS